MVSIVRILITGASGNVGAGMIRLLRKQHELVLYDLHPISSDLHTFRGDLRRAENLKEAVEGCDLVLHAAAWHGLHIEAHSRMDFWNLNVDGTFQLFDAAVEADVKKIIFMSSAAWNNRYGKYGFTKVIGEEICEYFWQNYNIKYAALRPAAFIPFASGIAGAQEMIQRFMNNDPDRRDVLECIRLAIEKDTYTNEVFTVRSVPPFSEEEVKQFESDCEQILEKHAPGAAALIRTYHALRPEGKPTVADIEKSTALLGWRPKHNLATFFKELVELEATGGINQLSCDYPLPLP